MGFERNLANFAGERAGKVWKFDSNTLKSMVIIRTKAGEIFGEAITFNQAYNDLYLWEGKRTRCAFSNISEDGLTDMLAATFFQGATVATEKAQYVLRNPGTTCGLCDEPSEGGETHIECARAENAWSAAHEAWEELSCEEMEYAA